MFELSHEVRVFILKQLSHKAMRLSELSSMLEITTAEVSRHLDRLSKTKLIEKKPDNHYYITNYGTMLLYGYKSSLFLIDNDSFFMRHQLNLPSVLMSYGPLTKGTISRGTLNNTTLINESSKNADMYIHVMSEEGMPTLTDLDIERAEPGIEVKKIYPQSKKIPQEYKGSKVEIRTLVELPFSLKSTEKIAGLAFYWGGSIDFEDILLGEDEEFKYWVELLFQYYWDKARPSRP